MRIFQKFGVVLMSLGLMAIGSGPVEAQKKGQSAKIHHGYVVGAEKVELKNNQAAKGALVGGAIAYGSTSGGSSSKKRRNTAIGATAGGLLGRKPDEKGMLYSVDTGTTVIQVVTDQLEIHIDDCVVVEETQNGANIRRVSPEVCDPASQDVVDALEQEFQEEAAECAAAKAEVIAAENDEALEFAMKKVSILCN